MASRRDTQVIHIDPTTGALGLDPAGDFESEKDAVEEVTRGSRWTATKARAILGYAAVGGVGLLLVATKVAATIPCLKATIYDFVFLSTNFGSQEFCFPL